MNVTSVKTRCIALVASIAVTFTTVSVIAAYALPDPQPAQLALASPAGQ
jgi:hypothetical protein